MNDRFVSVRACLCLFTRHCLNTDLGQYIDYLFDRQLLKGRAPEFRLSGCMYSENEGADCEIIKEFSIALIQNNLIMLVQRTKEEVRLC